MLESILQPINQLNASNSMIESSILQNSIQSLGGYMAQQSSIVIQNKKTSKLFFCLSLIKIHRDKKVERGAVIKALGICTRFAFLLNTYRPVLQVVLDSLVSCRTEKQEGLILSEL